jgi:hypothetical protein
VSNDDALRAWAAAQAAAAPQPSAARAARIADALNGWGKGFDGVDPATLERRVADVLKRCTTDENGCINHDFSPVRRTKNRDYFGMSFPRPGGKTTISIIRAVWTLQVGPLAPNQALRLLCGNDRCLNVGHYEVFVSGQALGIPGAVSA